MQKLPSPRTATPPLRRRTAMAGRKPEILERVYDLYAAALERNRDEFEAMARCLHRGASKSQRTEIARLRSNPSGQGLCGRPVRGGLRRCLAGRANPRNSAAIAAVSRAGGRPLASHPVKPLSRREEIVNTLLESARINQAGPWHPGYWHPGWGSSTWRCQPPCAGPLSSCPVWQAGPGVLAPQEFGGGPVPGRRIRYARRGGHQPMWSACRRWCARGKRLQLSQP